MSSRWDEQLSNEPGGCDGDPFEVIEHARSYGWEGDEVGEAEVYLQERAADEMLEMAREVL